MRQKIHAMTDDDGRPYALAVTAGIRSIFVAHEARALPVSQRAGQRLLALPIAPTMQLNTTLTDPC
jgi:hypothetical protein